MALGRRDRIAVVGGGAAGLGAAWMLAQKHDVTLYEAETTLGGHAFGHPFPGTDKCVDMGVMITLPWAYPNLYCMFQKYGVRTSAAGATLQVSFPDADGTERESWGTDSSLRQTPLFRRIEAQASRFEQMMFEVAALPLDMQTKPISYFLNGSVPGVPHSGGYEHEFMVKGLCPLLSLFLVTRDCLLETPAWSLSMMFRFGTISFFSPTTWRTIDGGTRDYVARLTRSFQSRQFLGAKVTSVVRANDSVVVRDDKGNSERYEEVVLATGADVALSLLETPTADESRLLGSFEYEPALAYLHQDPTVFAGDAPGVFFHYRSENRAPEAKLDGIMTYDMKRAAGLDLPSPTEPEKGPVLVSIVSKERDTPFAHTKKIQAFKHMIPNAAAMKARLDLYEIQGKNRVWFCGDYTTFSSHEDAFVSGMVVAEALGARYTFREHAPAFERYRQNRLLMLRYGLGTRLGLAARVELLGDLLGAVASEARIRLNDLFPD